MNKSTGLAIFLLFACGLVSCQPKGDTSLASIIKTGTYYNIQFPEGQNPMEQGYFKVVAVKGEWAQVEVLKPSILQALVFTELGKDSKTDDELRMRRKSYATELKKDIRTKWINLGAAKSIEEVPVEKLGILSEV